MTQERINQILDVLPHGSGINYEWTYTKFKNGNTSFHNYYIGMNHDGYYNRIVPFTVRVFQHKKDVLHKLKGPCEGRIQIIHKKGDWDYSVKMDNRWDDREYIEQVIEDMFEQLGIGKLRTEIIKEK